MLASFSPTMKDFGFQLKITEHCFVYLLGSWNARVLLQPSNITEFARGGRDIQTALAFSALARSPAAGPATMPVLGCNWKTPITEGHHFDGIP
jgi:hypothetical protein